METSVINSLMSPSLAEKNVGYGLRTYPIFGKDPHLRNRIDLFERDTIYLNRVLFLFVFTNKHNNNKE